MKIVPVLLLSLLFVFVDAKAAEVPMPAEADVAAAVAEAIDGRPVCEQLFWPLDADGKATFAPDQLAKRHPSIEKQLNELARIGFVTSRTVEEGDGPKRLIELTDKGRKHIRQENLASYLCYAARKLDRVEVYTPPAERDGYWIVRVTYTWRPSRIEPWSQDLFAAGALGRGGKSVSDERSDRIVLVLTQRGWKDQAWFGDPIK